MFILRFLLRVYRNRQGNIIAWLKLYRLHTGGGRGWLRGVLLDIFHQAVALHEYRQWATKTVRVQFIAIEMVGSGPCLVVLASAGGTL